MNEIAEQIIYRCESCFAANSGNCSGFVKAVASSFGINLRGRADDIVDEIRTEKWIQLSGGLEAKTKADTGFLVIGGLKGQDHIPAQNHGHVVIVVSGELDSRHHKYPMAYWGKLGSVGEKNKGVNYSWNRESRDKVLYSCLQVVV